MYTGMLRPLLGLMQWMSLQNPMLLMQIQVAQTAMLRPLLYLTMAELREDASFKGLFAQ